MTDAINSHGTLLKIGDGEAVEVFATILEVLDIQAPSLTQRNVEVTNHSSTDGWAEFLGTINEGGLVTFSCNFDPTNLTQGFTTSGLIKDLSDRTLRNFELVFPDTATTTWEFAALVENATPQAPVEGRLTIDITLKISGKPTLA